MNILVSILITIILITIILIIIFVKYKNIETFNILNNGNNIIFKNKNYRDMLLKQKFKKEFNIKLFEALKTQDVYNNLIECNNKSNKLLYK